jgi:hypothetical protein
MSLKTRLSVSAVEAPSNEAMKKSFSIDQKIGKVSDRRKNTLRSSRDSILHSPTQRVS